VPLAGATPVFEAEFELLNASLEAAAEGRGTGSPFESLATTGTGFPAEAALAAVGPVLRRQLFSSTPRTREAKVREQMVSAASEASGEAYSTGCYDHAERHRKASSAAVAMRAKGVHLHDHERLAIAL
jgi:hypothetical protein